MTPIDPRTLRNAFGTFMTGVTVVTALDHNKAPIGFTANSFTSVSLDPPLVLVCVANSSKNYAALAGADGFAVNILAENQIEISNTFARPSEDRFAHVAWHPGPAGSPVLQGGSAWFDCTMHQTVDAGDHMILIGQVRAFDSSIHPGLGYVRGAYVTPSTSTEAIAQHAKLIVSALIVRDNQVLLQDDGNGGLALPEIDVTKGGASDAIKHVIAKTGLRAEPGFVYALYEDTGRKIQHIVFLCQASDGAPHLGAFVPISASAFDDVTDPATLSMLQRFATESTLENYGVYYGNHNSGEVRFTA
ncbi:MAG: flavin reductase [Thalassovita sp.]